MSLIYLLDTNTISEPIKKIPNQQVLEKLARFAPVCAISAFTVFELIKGAYQIPESKKRQAILNYAEKTFSQFPILPYTKDSANWHGQETARLISIGKSPSFLDSQIAAVAKINHLVLVTRNTDDFKYFADLKLENWFI